MAHTIYNQVYPESPSRATLGYTRFGNSGVVVSFTNNRVLGKGCYLYLSFQSLHSSLGLLMEKYCIDSYSRCRVQLNGIGGDYISVHGHRYLSIYIYTTQVFAFYFYFYYQVPSES